MPYKKSDKRTRQKIVSLSQRRTTVLSEQVSATDLKLIRKLKACGEQEDFSCVLYYAINRKRRELRRLMRGWLVNEK